MGNGVAEFVGTRRHELDRAVAVDLPVVPAGPRRSERRKDLFEELALECPQRLRREFVAPLRPFEPLLRRRLLDQFLHLPAEHIELVHLPLFEKLAQRLHVDQADAGVLLRLFELSQQFVDRFQLFLHLQRLGHRELFPAGEVPLRRQFVDLIGLAEAVHQADELHAKPALVVVLGIPQPLKLPDLLLANSPLERVAMLGRRLHLLGGGMEGLPRLLPHAVGLVAFEDLPLAGLEFLDHPRQRRPQPLDLLRIEHDCFGELFFGQFVDVAELEHVLHGGRDEIDLWRPRWRNPRGVVSLVTVDDPAEGVTVWHGMSAFGQGLRDSTSHSAMVRGWPRPVAGRSLRASCPSLTRC